MRAIAHIPAAEVVSQPLAVITLTKDQRHRRRISLMTDNGLEFLLDLPRAVQLAHGDGLQLEDGQVILVAAEPEPLMAVRARDAHHLLVLAWHLGNRHLEAQIEGDRILVRRDHVIEDMLKGLGARTELVIEPFTPQGGAYGDAHAAHHHHHDDSHGHHHHDHHHHGHGGGDAA
jgi:urease accessory protein